MISKDEFEARLVGRNHEEVVQELASWELQALLLEYRTQARRYEEAQESAQGRIDELLNKLHKAKTLIEEVLNGDTEAEQTYSDFQEAFELLEVEATKQHRVEVIVTWRGTIELPLGKSVDDLDGSEFDSNQLTHDTYYSDLDWYDCSVTSR